MQVNLCSEYQLTTSIFFSVVLLLNEFTVVPLGRVSVFIRAVTLDPTFGFLLSSGTMVGVNLTWSPASVVLKIVASGLLVVTA